MSVLQEFKKFALRGNVIDMAVGIIIGAAFTTVVKSLVDDVIMPPIGYVTNGVDFKQMSYKIKDPTYEEVNGEKTMTKPAITLNYGAFINNVINFLIVAACVFLVVKAVNALQKQPVPPAPTEKKCPHCWMLVPLEAKRCGHCTSTIAI